VTISEGGPPRDVLDDGARPAGSLRVSASGLRVRLGGRDILNGLDIAVNAGELVAVSGPSGVGKTTLLLVLAGALSPDSGVVEVLGGGRRSPAGGDDVGRVLWAAWVPAAVLRWDVREAPVVLLLLAALVASPVKRRCTSRNC